MTDQSQKQQARDTREKAAIRQAQQQNKPVVYVDDDGCEVTATPTGHALYNAADWW